MLARASHQRYRMSATLEAYIAERLTLAREKTRIDNHGEPFTRGAALR